MTIFDPSSPIDLCDCGNVLLPDDGNECWNCRVKKAPVTRVPEWPLYVVIMVAAILSTLLGTISLEIWGVVR